MPDRENVIKGLERCIEKLDTVVNKMHGFNCTACPYFHKCDSSGYLIGLPLMRDALALLKAQEPRVMTLEEVTEDRPDVVWFDDRHYKLTYPAFVSNGDVTGWVVSLSKGCYERHDNIDGYGREWRCWTSRPDEKRRAETPWQQ